MKKRLLTLSLVSLMSAALLGSCASDPYTWKQGVIVTINDKDYTVDDLFAQYDTTIDGARAYYETINNILVWLVEDTTSTMDSEVNALIDDFNEQVSTNATTNGTSEREEREILLEQEGVKDMEGLRNKYYLDRKKTANENSFYSDETYESTLIKNLIDNYYPYHVRHILVNVDASGDQLVDGKITEDDANQFANLYSRLISEDETFGQVAVATSDDTSSGANFGDVGIVAKKNASQFVSEFQYAMYTYDAYFNPDTADKAADIKTALDIPSEADDIIGQSLYGIPSYVFDELSTYADVTRNSSKEAVENSTENNYPRNILFNKYLNNHGTSVIYYNDKSNMDAAGNIIDINLIPSRYKLFDNVKLRQYIDDSSTGENTLGDITTENRYILCDDSERPILVTRAGTGTSDSGYQGVHFIVVQRDPFVETDDLSDYYRLEIPSTTNPDTTATDSYINFIKTDDRSVYTARATAIKDAARAVYPNVDFEMFRHNLAEAGDSVVIPTKIMNLINQYIDSVEQTTVDSEDEAYSDTWTAYMDQLSLKEELDGRVMPESCISEFYNNVDGVIEKGSVCYAKR